MSEMHDVWRALKQGAARGALEARRGYFAPLKPRFWRYIASEARKGPKAALQAFWTGYDLIIADQLDRQGHVRKGRDIAVT